MSNILLGTCWFPTLNDAQRYYRELGYSKEDVDRKIESKEIFIGKPETTGNDLAILKVDAGASKRWFIETKRT
jgi:hypothetical protein